MSAHDHAKPIGGTILDPLMKICLALFAVSVAFMAYRFYAGVGPVSNMTDGFTWGIWEPINVVVFTGIGAGAYAVGLLCYLLNKGEYHPLVRPAVLVGAIAYTLGGSSIMIALGRYWNAVLIPMVGWWNLSSALLEVAVCVMLYVSVLWIEVLPSVLEGAAGSSHPKWSAIGKKYGPMLAKAMPYIIALAILLPTMHQSSLGGLMLIGITKVHPLWHTALLPTLFLISCLSMGYGTVVVLVNLLNVTWRAKLDQPLFARMSKVNAGLLLLYVVVRLVDIAAHGKLRYLGMNVPTLLFVVEMALFIVPGIMFFMPGVQANRGKLFGAAALSILAGAMYRADAYMSVYRPAGWNLGTGEPVPAGWQYWPSVGETVVTLGMAAVGIAIFLFISRKFPVVAVQDRTHNVGGHVRAASSR
ncbi:MAG: Ni/Fe-hydrogenase cytochrome b subunit [Anaeromyxobacter sp.]